MHEQGRSSGAKRTPDMLGRRPGTMRPPVVIEDLQEL